MAQKKTISKTKENNILLDAVVKGMDELKAEDITVIDLRRLKNAVADYFVICSGNSDSHIDAISGEVEKQVYLETKQDPWKKEGKQNKEWILLDYVDVVAHVFKKDKRHLFALEDLWGDGEISRPSVGTLTLETTKAKETKKPVTKPKKVAHAKKEKTSPKATSKKTSDTTALKKPISKAKKTK